MIYTETSMGTDSEVPWFLIPGKEETATLIKETSEVLGKIDMKVKGWAESGVEPPEEMSQYWDLAS